jgi:hypothetical protein
MGLEIKWDDKFATTGNLFIETAEKKTADQPTWTPSGIDRDDNAWLYGIGNYAEFFLFSKRTLREVARRPGVRIQENSRRTGRGFLLPRLAASECCERAFAWLDGGGNT